MNGSSTGSDVKTTPVRVLIVENNPDDAELMTQLLEADGLNFTANRAETELEFIAGLESGVDVILCDHTLPMFSASRALELVRDRNALVPLLIVSGTISEGLAVEFMQRVRFGRQNDHLGVIQQVANGLTALVGLVLHDGARQ